MSLCAAHPSSQCVCRRAWRRLDGWMTSSVESLRPVRKRREPLRSPLNGHSNGKPRSQKQRGVFMCNRVRTVARGAHAASAVVFLQAARHVAGGEGKAACRGV